MDKSNCLRNYFLSNNITFSLVNLNFINPEGEKNNNTKIEF